jgi:DNA-binding NarL/FixJ family response regulator
VRVVIVTTFDTDEYVYGALRAGAAGFLLKDAGPALLIEAVRAAGAGDALISPSITVRLLQRLAPPPARRPGRTRHLVLGRPDHGKLTVMPRPPSGRAAAVSSAP